MFGGGVWLGGTGSQSRGEGLAREGVLGQGVGVHHDNDNDDMFMTP